MKHPNKKVEAIRKEYAWALMVHKRMNVKSCFDWWLADNYLEPIDMNENNLLVAVSNIRRGGKTIKVELADL